MDILRALAPLVRQVAGPREHDLIEPYNLQFLLDGALKSKPHFVLLGLKPFIQGSLWHLGRADDLLLDEVSAVDSTQAPGLDEFIRVLSVEQDASLLDALGDPRQESGLGSQELDVILIEAILPLSHLAFIC